MMYEDKDLPKGSSKKPYIYTNFVTTVDGKVQILDNWKDYWPIGSRIDYKVLTELRALSDVLIHGSGTAKLSPFVTKIQSAKLRNIRKSLNKRQILPYVVLSNNPDDRLIAHLKNYQGGKAYLVTNDSANISRDAESSVKILRIGRGEIDLVKLINFLTKKLKARRILMEGGPTLLGSFLRDNLINELFLTVSPKIVGNEKGKTLTLVENTLFPAMSIKNLKILSVKVIGDELFLRYKIQNT